ncbi:DUF89 domain-containing protein [Acidobacteriota bacterium]
MKISLECYPCLLRNALDAAKAASTEKDVQQQALQAAMKILQDVPLDTSPPAIASAIHRRIREITGNPDPYAVIKEEQNSYLLQLEPFLIEHVRSAKAPLWEAVKLSAACNAIDLGPSRDWSLVQEISDQLLEPPMGRFDRAELEKSLMDANSLLFIGDNAGEIVGDKILITFLKALGNLEITFAVRGGPILNDATQEDAKRVGMDRYAHVITTGLDCPGVILSECSDEFRKCYENADVILAKGQGNYETLVDGPREVYCLLQAKCQVVAEDLGADLGEINLVSSKKA